jgi:hypothetical protein
MRPLASSYLAWPRLEAIPTASTAASSSTTACSIATTLVLGTASTTTGSVAGLSAIVVRHLWEALASDDENGGRDCG